MIQKSESRMMPGQTGFVEVGHVLKKVD